jgi:hypothetical protein
MAGLATKSKALGEEVRGASKDAPRSCGAVPFTLRALCAPPLPRVHAMGRSVSSAQEGHSEQALDQHRSMTNLQVECSYRRADSVIRRFNVGRVMVLNMPPAAAPTAAAKSATTARSSPAHHGPLPFTHYKLMLCGSNGLVGDSN